MAAASAAAAAAPPPAPPPPPAPAPPPPPPPLWRAVQGVLRADSAAACADALAALVRADARTPAAAAPELDARALQLLAAADLRPRALLRNVLFAPTATGRAVRTPRRAAPRRAVPCRRAAAPPRRNDAARLRRPLTATLRAFPSPYAPIARRHSSRSRA